MTDQTSDRLQSFDPELYARMPRIVRWSARRSFPWYLERFPDDQDTVRRVRATYGRGIYGYASLGGPLGYGSGIAVSLSGGHGVGMVLGCVGLALFLGWMAYNLALTRVMRVALRKHQTELEVGLESTEMRAFKLVLAFMARVCGAFCIGASVVGFVHSEWSKAIALLAIGLAVYLAGRVLWKRHVSIS